ncbi:tRNA dihydrouridine synthase DusB [Sinimarinibacterium sp. CAU 1509]|uniref:tRNA dihydrouridine synthase DusB n=1 Tax=Sinimarinibacterium sp. CAU 1509 TaxID=2562283 RepID=UPI0010AB60A7|nr:tRNA dihydrouridine synthase DusB [Sinimarinibacterium sp. CAU 1509]TJY63115.1 tRNA dihydrouridine synthase DusB [Sinimarinibacterium sp. CAU 1509]
MRIGSYQIDPKVILAPMAGVTDRPFRQLCRRLGAGLAVSEMTTSDASLWHTEKSRLRRDHRGEPGPIAVQIAGYDPQALAEAARYNVEHGAQIVDINMGCPAKKVCRVDSGSALLRDEALVSRICDAVVRAVEVPVTLKIRTGYSRASRNGVTIARIAEAAGIQALAVHGRTREEHYSGQAEYDTIAAIKQSVRIPVIANGDVDTPQKAAEVLRATGADAVMIGRAAQGRPWIFRQIVRYLDDGTLLPEPDAGEVRDILLGHLDDLYAFYGEGRGLRVARKHIQWYCKDHPGTEAFWTHVSRIDDAARQRAAVAQFTAAGSQGDGVQTLTKRIDALAA